MQKKQRYMAGESSSRSPAGGKVSEQMQFDEQQNIDAEEQGNPFNPLDTLRQMPGRTDRKTREDNQGLEAPGTSGQEIGQQNREFGGMDEVPEQREQQALGGVNSTDINQSQQPTGPGPMPGN